jgi:hypothetical protein
MQVLIDLISYNRVCVYLMMIMAKKIAKNIYLLNQLNIRIIWFYRDS